MDEVVYVWNLKQALNKISRQLGKIKPRMESGEVNALVVMNFYYQGSKQLYTLDNNTITMEELNANIRHLEGLLDEREISVSLDQFSLTLLDDLH